LQLDPEVFQLRGASIYGLMMCGWQPMNTLRAQQKVSPREDMIKWSDFPRLPWRFLLIRGSGTALNNEKIFQVADNVVTTTGSECAILA
jgi:hypothetical protein